MGCIIVAASHYGFFQFFTENYRTLFRGLSGVVPVFFIISGYLCGREFSVKRVLRQAYKYGVVYLIIEIGMEIIYFTKIFFKTGEIHFPGFIANVLRCFVMDNNEMGWTGQLWFLLVLTYSLILNAFFPPKSRRAVIAAVLSLRVALALFEGEAVTAFFELLLKTVPLVGRVIHVEETNWILVNFLTGLLFTTIGFDIKTWRVRPISFFLIALPFSVFGVLTHHPGIVAAFLSIAHFYWIKQLPGRFLRPYHAQISLFSVLMYFLHMLEKQIFGIFTDNALLSFVLVIILNLLLTALITGIKRITASTKRMTDAIKTQYFNTGDWGYVKGNLLFIVGRSINVINRSGEKIIPADIEHVIETFDKVEAISVFGIPSDTHGEDICAVVKTGDGTPAFELSQLKDRLPKFMIPQHLLFLKEFPINATGKTDISALKKYAAARCRG